MSNVITILSGKGGAGKSTISVYLGRTLASRGKTVLLIEMDAGLRGMDLMLSTEGMAVYDLSDVLSNRCKIDQAIMTPVNTTGLQFLAAANDPGFVPDEEGFHYLIQNCRAQYDFIIIDAPAGLGRGVTLSVSQCDLALVVATPDPVTVRDCARAGQLATRCGADSRLIINQVPARLRGATPDLDAVIDGAGVRLLGVIPLDDEMRNAPAQGRDMSACPAKTAIQNIAARLCGEQRELLVE